MLSAMSAEKLAMTIATANADLLAEIPGVGKKTAHRIIVLKDGQIGESGTHEELLAKNGIYTRIYRTQFAEEDLVAPAALHPADGGS